MTTENTAHAAAAQTATVPPELHGTRADVGAAQLFGLPRGSVATAIAQGRLMLNGQPPKKAGATLRAGMELQFWPLPPPSMPAGASLPAPEILFQNREVVVCHKPAGLATHADAHHTDALTTRLLAAGVGLSAVGAYGRRGREAEGRSELPSPLENNGRGERMSASRRSDLFRPEASNERGEGNAESLQGGGELPSPLEKNQGGGSERPRSGEANFPPPLYNRPGVVHRLDLPTSGVIILAKTDAAHAQLARAFANRQVKKTYLAVAKEGKNPLPNRGTIDAPLGADPQSRIRRAVSAAANARPARTHFVVLGRRADGTAALKIDLETGRTHQIRVHLAALGCPLVGDQTYGGPPAPRLLLHAWRLALDVPGAGQQVFTVQPPADMGLAAGEIDGV